MRLVIAEKPSVAMALASVIGARSRRDGFVEGDGYLVSWCVGHLVGLCDAADYDERYRKWNYDDLPIVPEKWKKKILEGTKKQFGILQTLMNRNDVTEVICGTDAGREGELIFRLVYEQAGCRKPVKRLWISSMEEKAIREGFQNLKDGSCYDDLYRSALCRAQADWLVGINGSRLFSVLYNKNLKVGRVQTPTLAMIVERNQKVTSFKKEQYFEAHLFCRDLEAVSDRMNSLEEAEQLVKQCQGKRCQIIRDEEQTKTVQPPKLYDLTTLQRDANRILGYTAQETLDAAQSLYEKIINKTDADTEKPLKGVEYELRDSKGKVLEKLVTDAAGHAESGLYEIATYKNGKFSEAIKYYLVETKALDGYELDQTKLEIVFEYADQNTPIIEVKKDLTNKEAQPGTPGTPISGNPKTGDETNLWLPVVLMLSAAAVMTGVLVSGKKKKKQNKSEKSTD